MTHYQPKASFMTNANAIRITLDGFDVLIALHVGGKFKATFMNATEHTEYYNEILFDMLFDTTDAAIKQCKYYVNNMLESAYEMAYDL